MLTPPPRSPRVLIVDPSSETRAVLTELLERDGATVYGAANLEAAKGLAIQRRPDVTVIDADVSGPDEIAGFADLGGSASGAIVLAGTNRPREAAEMRAAFLRKPYHYRALLSKIWESCEEIPAPAKAAA